MSDAERRARLEAESRKRILEKHPDLREKGLEARKESADGHDAFSKGIEGKQVVTGAFAKARDAEKPVGATPENPAGPIKGLIRTAAGGATTLDAAGCEKGPIYGTQHLYMSNCP